MHSQQLSSPATEARSSPLRVFGPAGQQPAPAGPTSHWTVRQFYEQFFRPNYLEARRRRPGTIKLYDQVVGLWEQLTPDPSLCLLEQEDCREFVARLQDRPGLNTPQMASNTVRKLCVHLQKVLDYAGPRSRRNRSSAQLIVDVPYLERPEKVEDPPDGDFTLEEIGLWLGACRLARPTANLAKQNPAQFHRNLIIFVYNTALRIDSIMQADWPMVDRIKPGWITIPATIYKGRKRGQEFYINRHARSAIEDLRRDGQERLFAWLGWPNSSSWLQSCRRKILAKTAIPEARRFGFHGLRRTLITWLAQQNPMLASIVAGHSNQNVTRDYYVNPNAIKDLMESVPQPQIIESERQLTLF